MKTKITGSKYCLNIYLGKQVIAHLMLLEDLLHWQYTDTWQKTGYAISPHLPLHGNIPSLNVQRFLRNFLPEGQCLEELLNTFHLSKQNTFGLVRALGLDLPGALIMLNAESNQPAHSTFRPISSRELEERLDTHETFNLIIWDGKPRLSVSGVQDKINILINTQQELGFGEGNLCSTHLLKFEKKQQAFLVINEFISMKLAEFCGIHTANVTLQHYGKHPVLLVKRFDRQFVSMHEVNRRHVIDGCQALNLPPDYKYERNFGSGRDVAHIRDGASLEQLFKIANQCINPALTKKQMLDWVLFNLLIFNCDAHGKNISFFVNKQGMSLAPFYDLVNIKMFPNFEQEIAMGLGDTFGIDEIYAYQLADFADTCQLPRQLIVSRLKALTKSLTQDWKQHLTQWIKQDIELDYLEQYYQLIQTRNDHFKAELPYIISTRL